MGTLGIKCLIGYVEKKTEALKIRCSSALKRALLKIAHDNGSDLSKVCVDALEAFVIKAKGKKIIKKLIFRKK